MQLSFRWFGPEDPVRLAEIRQIPGMHGVVTALHDVPTGEVWPLEALKQRRATIDEGGLDFKVVESIPVHEDIKLGRPTRDRFIDAFCTSIEHVAAVGVDVVCYNFMPVFDWTRTDLTFPLPDGSTTLAYDDAATRQLENADDLTTLPGWPSTDDPDEIKSLVAAYQTVSEDALWSHLGYFLERVIPVAAANDVRLAIHPDDPPWPLLGLPRIITDGDALERVTQIVDHSANGITLCTGSLGANPTVDLPAIVRQLEDRIHFVHVRNVAVTGSSQFYETAHPDGDLDLSAVIRVLKEVGYTGPLRPDHGRMIWGENGRPGYGLYDRALGATYLRGLWDAA